MRREREREREEEERERGLLQAHEGRNCIFLFSVPGTLADAQKQFVE